MPQEEDDTDQELNEELIRTVLELRQVRRSSSYETGHESRESLAEEETTEALSGYEGFEAAPDMLFEDEENSDDNIMVIYKAELVVDTFLGHFLPICQLAALKKRHFAPTLL